MNGRTHGGVGDTGCHIPFVDILVCILIRNILPRLEGRQPYEDESLISRTRHQCLARPAVEFANAWKEQDARAPCSARGFVLLVICRAHKVGGISKIFGPGGVASVEGREEKGDGDSAADRSSQTGLDAPVAHLSR